MDKLPAEYYASPPICQSTLWSMLEPGGVEMADVLVTEVEGEKRCSLFRR